MDASLPMKSKPWCAVAVYVRLLIKADAADL